MCLLCNYFSLFLPPIVALKSTPADRNGGQDQCRAQIRDWQDLQEGEFLLQVTLVPSGRTGAHRRRRCSYANLSKSLKSLCATFMSAAALVFSSSWQMGLEEVD